MKKKSPSRQWRALFSSDRPDIRFLSQVVFIVRPMNVIYIDKAASEEFTRSADICLECDCSMVVTLTEDGTEVLLECDCTSGYLVA